MKIILFFLSYPVSQFLYFRNAFRHERHRCISTHSTFLDLCRMLREGVEEELPWENKERRGQKPRNLAFCFDTPHLQLLGPGSVDLILLINLSAVGLPWWKIAFGGREHLVTYAAGTDSKATECQLQITDRTIQQIVYMFGSERTHTLAHTNTHV